MYKIYRFMQCAPKYLWVFSAWICKFCTWSRETIQVLIYQDLHIHAVRAKILRWIFELGRSQARRVSLEIIRPNNSQSTKSKLGEQSEQKCPPISTLTWHFGRYNQFRQLAIGAYQNEMHTTTRSSSSTNTFLHVSHAFVTYRLVWGHFGKFVWAMITVAAS